MTELQNIGERLRELDLQDLVSISQAVNGAIPPVLNAVVDGPQEIDYDENANPQMSFLMDEMRAGADLTKLEKRVVQMAQKEITRRIVKRSRTGTRHTRANKRGGKKNKKSQRRKGRCTRRR